MTVRLLVCAAVLLAWVAAPAAAHERRTVEGYEFVVGWITEPAFAGVVNGVDLGVTRGAAPVEGAERTLKVEVITGPDRRTFDLRTRFRMPGRYVADIVPTRTGDYRFRFFGTIGDRPIDVTFDSADGRFHGVEPLSSIQFPAEAGAATDLQSALASTRGLAVAALAVGVLALVVGGMGLARRR